MDPQPNIAIKMDILISLIEMCYSLTKNVIVLPQCQMEIVSAFANSW